MGLEPITISRDYKPGQGRATSVMPVAQITTHTCFSSNEYRGCGHGIDGLASVWYKGHRAGVSGRGKGWQGQTKNFSAIYRCHCWISGLSWNEHTGTGTAC